MKLLLDEVVQMRVCVDTQRLIISDETADKIGRTFKGLFAVLDIIRQGFSAVFKTLSPLLGGLGTLSGGILDVTASFGDWLVRIDEAAKKGDVFNRVSLLPGSTSLPGTGGVGFPFASP